MRVKRLELFGFKSFAVKTTVHFEPGVTAIVGPNGSGKSNLVDSIRWVLGEHNPRDVRAPRLEDVIFNGTDTKAPLSMAEVSLVIDNEQGRLPISFSEVMITRRVYRSGESEVFINQSPCRLKDVQELFLGTGLGGGTYAIIEQGHIDMILSSKPEERRAVFEEASGVAKYLSKKQETLRRLDDVEQDLTRVADIVSEVRRQLHALERQAARARTYKNQWDRLKAWELRLAADELRQGEQAKRALQESLADLGGRAECKDTDKRQLVSSLESANQGLSAIQTELQERRTRLVSLASQIEQHTGQRALKEGWIQELATQQQQLREEAAQCERQAQALTQQAEQVAAQRAVQDAQQRASQTQREQARLAHDALEESLRQTLAAIERAKSELFDAASTATQQRNSLTSLTLRGESVQAQRQRIAQQRGELQTKLDAALKRRQQAEQERCSLEEQQETLRGQMTQLGQSLAQAHQERHQLMGRLNELRERALHQRAKVQVLEEMCRRFEGFPEAVKALMSQPPEGALGVLVDVLEPMPGCERALEAALGPLALAIVVQDRQALRRCQEALKRQQQLAQACVIVAADCPAQPTPELAMPGGREGFLGTLSQLVRCEPAHQPLARWLLNRWGVVDHISRVFDLSDGCWVSQAGDRWDGTSWQVVGGRPAASVHVGRKQRWEQAAQELSRTEQDLATMQSAWQQAELRWQELSSRQDDLRRQADTLMPKVSRADAHLSQSAHEAKRLQEELAARRMDDEDLARQQQELDGAARQAQDGVSAAEAQHQRAEGAARELHTAHDQAVGRRQQLAVTQAQLEASLSSLTERVEGARMRLEELSAQQAQLGAQAQAKRAQADDRERRASELSAQREDHRRQAETLDEEHVRLNVETDGIARQVREHEQSRDQIVPQLLAVEQELLSLSQRRQEQERQLSERDVRRAHILERLHEVYKMDEATILSEQAVEQAPMMEDARQALIRQVDQLKGKLEGMGPVSLGSVDEYDQLKQRLDFLQTQQGDLAKAQDDLKRSLSQINRTARAQFRDTFETIRSEFKHYFTRLFGGGEANLILMDEEDVLESGIDIVARPPGKRLQSISLLSGGERALTAIALLFALFKVRPSPFCILDEIDAPLDEANVDRFTKVLEEFLSLSQFILITHNKQTIIKADCLYGVTMEQPGMSKIVSVKLRKPKHPAPAAPAEPAEAVATS